MLHYPSSPIKGDEVEPFASAFTLPDSAVGWRISGWRFMRSVSSSKNQLNAAAASRCWVARAGTERMPWPHPYRRSVTDKLQSGVLPRNGLDSCLEAGSPCAQESNEQELR